MMRVLKRDNRKEAVKFDKITARIEKLCYGLSEYVDPVAVADLALMHPAVQDAIAVGLRLPDVSDDELKLNIILKDGEKFDEAEFCTWMAEQCIIAMVPRFIEIFDGWPMTATQKVKVAELKEITDKTWDRAKAGLKFSARK